MGKQEICVIVVGRRWVGCRRRRPRGKKNEAMSLGECLVIYIDRVPGLLGFMELLGELKARLRNIYCASHSSLSLSPIRLAVRVYQNLRVQVVSVRKTRFVSFQETGWNFLGLPVLKYRAIVHRSTAVIATEITSISNLAHG